MNYHNTEQGNAQEELIELSKAALQLSDVSSGKSIFIHIAESLYSFFKDSFVMTSSYLPETKELILQQISGDSDKIAHLIEILGSSPIGCRYPIPTETEQVLQTGKLKLADGGMHTFGCDLVPKAIGEVFERVFNIGQIYALGLTRGGKLLGDIVIVLKKGDSISHPDMIELFANHASLALQRHFSENSLLLSESRIQEIWEKSFDGMRLIGHDGNIVMVNHAYCTMVGMTRDQLIGNPFTVVYEDENEEAIFHRSVEKIQTHGINPHSEKEMKLKNGRRIWFEMSNSYLADGTLLSICRDITDRKSIEMGRHAILDNIPHMAWMKDRNHRFIAVNEPFAQLWKIPADSLIGKTDFDILPAHRAAQYEKDDDEIVQTGKPRWIEEMIQETLDIQWAEIFKAPIKDAAGMIIGITGIAQDITDRKAAEVRLVDNLKEKEILVKEIHHRVKNNLQIITSLLDLQSDTIDDSATVDHFREARNRVRSMALIHEKLYQSEAFSHLDIADYIRDLIEELFSIYGNRDNAVEYAMAVEKINLDLDQAILCGLIINELVTNALKYAFPGARRGTISISCSIVNKYVTLGICDDGIGIPDTIDIESTHTLGLQLVSMLILQLHGTLTVDRQGGTDYSIRFPVRPPRIM